MGHLLSASDDMTVCLWDVQAATQQSTFLDAKTVSLNINHFRVYCIAAFEPLTCFHSGFVLACSKSLSNVEGRIPNSLELPKMLAAVLKQDLRASSM